MSWNISPVLIHIDPVPSHVGSVYISLLPVLTVYVRICVQLYRYQLLFLYGSTCWLVRYTKLFPHLGNFPSTYGEEWTITSFWTIGFNYFAVERHLFQADLFCVCWVTKEISKQYNLVRRSTFCFSWRAGSTFELAHLTRCLVMLKTIIMGERQESVVGMRNGTLIVQC